MRLASSAGVPALLLLAVLVLAAPRADGASWHDIAIPFAQRELEGHSVTWEYSVPAVAVTATLGSEPQPTITTSFITDQYRALLPTYLAALLTSWIHSSYWSFMAVDVLGWWLGSWATWGIARRLSLARPAAAAAAVVTVASPLAAYQVGAGTLHVASSLSLPVAFLGSLVALERPGPGWQKTALLCGALFAASLTYNYQWVVVPALLALAPWRSARWRWVLHVCAAAAGFAVLTVVTQHALALLGLTVQPHVNDPVRVLEEKWHSGELLSTTYWRGTGLAVGQYLVTGYTWLGLLLAAIGAWRGPGYVRALAAVGVVSGVVSAAVFPITWVALSGYVFVYLAEAVGVCFVAGRATAALAHRSAGLQRASRRHTVFGTLVAALLLLLIVQTNTDLLGRYGYVMRWFDYRHTPY